MPLVPTDKDQWPLGSAVPKTTIGPMTLVGADRMLIESALPAPDATIAKHVLVAADPATTFLAASTLDLLTVRTPLLRASIWIRDLPARVGRRSAPPLPQLIVGKGTGLPGWMLLGEQPNREIVLGAVGRFWTPVIEWRDVDASDFLSFGEPGWGKIAVNFTVLPYGEHSTLLTYGCRTATTDPESQRRFLRYWALVRPFVGHIMAATLNKIKANAEASAT